MMAEGYSVYRRIMADLKSIGGRASKAARMNAVLLARHADLYAKAIAEKTGKKFTALDYYHTFAIQAGREGDAEGGLYQRTVEKEKEAVRKQYAGTASWMKAPNGKATNLTEDQWLTVRTSAFKAWFGDWEQVARLMLPRQAKNLDEAASAARSVVGQDLTNSVLGIHAILSNTNIAKMVSASATRKSVDAKIHALAVANVDHLFSRATAEYTHKDRDNDRNIKQIHRLFSPFVVGGKVFAAELTVKELAQEKEGNRLYSVEALEIKEASRKWNAAYNTTEGVLTSFPQEAFDQIVSKISEEVNKSSKVVDENGEPLVVYHGTLSDFTKFRPSESGLYGKGIYLTADKEDTSYTLKDKDWRIMELFANIQNPRDPEAMATQADIDAAKKEALDFFEKRPFDKDGTPASFVVNNLLFWGMQPGKVKKSKLTQILKDAFARKGVAYQENDKHDGAIIQRDGATWYTADQPNQVKSATDNTGAFSAMDVDIYHQSNEIVSRAEERLRADEKSWNAMIDRYDAADKRKWEKEENGTLFHVMDVPLVLQILNIPYDSLHVFGSFFAHSVNKNHKGMTLDLLRQLPRKMADPLMITRGNKPDSYVFAVGLKDANGATIVVPVEINKNVERDGATANIINSAFGKTAGKKGNKASLKWFEKQFNNNNVLYMNKKESITWLQSYWNGSPAIVATSNALSASIVSGNFQNVKTETDLEAVRRSSFGVYQRVRNANQGRIVKNSEGGRVIELFEGADASTFLHEMGHMFLMDLEDLAALEDEGSKRDLATVDEWAAWNEGAAKDYEGSPWAEEFRAREQAILDAHAAGDVLTEKKLKEEWRQERIHARRVAQMDMLLKKSSFMSNRINNMERDIRMDSHGLSLTDSVTEWLRDHAYRPLTWTDLLLLHVSENVVCKGKIFML